LIWSPAIRITWVTESTRQPMIRGPTVTTIVRESASTGRRGRFKSGRRFTIGMIAPHRLATPSMEPATSGRLATAAGITISRI